MLACGCTPAVGSATGFRCFLSCPSLSSGLWLGWFLWILFSLLALNLRNGVTPAGSRLVSPRSNQTFGMFFFPFRCFLVFPLSYKSGHLLSQVCWSVPTCTHAPVVSASPCRCRRVPGSPRCGRMSSDVLGFLPCSSLSVAMVLCPSS